MVFGWLGGRYLVFLSWKGDFVVEAVGMDIVDSFTLVLFGSLFYMD